VLASLPTRTATLITLGGYAPNLGSDWNIDLYAL
jgi:hypothetical protein